MEQLRANEKTFALQKFLFDSCHRHVVLSSCVFMFACDVMCQSSSSLGQCPCSVFFNNIVMNVGPKCSQSLLVIVFNVCWHFLLVGTSEIAFEWRRMSLVFQRQCVGRLFRLRSAFLSMVLMYIMWAFDDQSVKWFPAIPVNSSS